MKKTSLLLIFVMIISLLLGSCSFGGGQGGDGGETEIITVTISAAKASVGADELSTAESTIKGVITAIDDLGNMTVSDDTGSLNIANVKAKTENGKISFSEMTEKPQKGDQVFLDVSLMRLDGSVSAYSAVILKFVKGEGDAYSTLSISEALEIAATLAHDTTTEELYYVSGVIESVSNYIFGNMTITDENGNSIFIYGTYDMAGVEYGQLESKPDVGDTVKLLTVVSNYNGPQLKNAKIVSVIPAEEDTREYEKMTVAAAREKAVGDAIEIDGVVASVTYATGFVPVGFILVDETSSIYVYSSRAASEVAVGNTVTVRGIRDSWILDTEKVNAEKFGYQGCLQLSDAKVVNNDKKTDGVFDKSWIEEITVKDLVETPVTENITTKLYKVTALIKEVPGNGFTNFYFFDIDGETGAYAYTQCNGEDFTWLRKYDNKFCTVYVTALNAKATSSDCYFRFLPVAVEDNGFTFGEADAPKYAVDYQGMTQLKGEYTGDPALTLIGSHSSELLGVSGITLEYSSDNESVVKFTKNADGTYLMNCPGFGNANVTVTAKLGDYVYSDTISISVVKKTSGDSSSVADAIAAEVGSTVTVTGIVGPSIIHNNHIGFYLMGEREMIAISFLDGKVIKDLAIGNTVTIKGTRDSIKSTQIAITNATIVNNEYGSKALPEKVVIDGVAVGEIYKTADTTHIYRVKATPKFINGGYSKTYEISGVQLYSNNPEIQYIILQDYIDKEVTLLVCLANWNGKSYKPCVIGVETENGVVYNEYCFDK